MRLASFIRQSYKKRMFSVIDEPAVLSRMHSISVDTYHRLGETVSGEIEDYERSRPHTAALVIEVCVAKLKRRLLPSG